MSELTRISDDHLDCLNGNGGITRRRLLQFAATTLLVSLTPLARGAAAGVLAVRVWPADDYTRVTVESTAALNFKQFTVDNPDRLVVDLEGVDYGSVLQSLSSKVVGDDPYIKGVRVGRYQKGIVRLVFDLKGRIKPDVFALPPVAEYGHRLVIDLRPLEPHSDPLLALLATPSASASAAKPASAADANAGSAKPEVVEQEPAVEPAVGKRSRPLVVAIDPGHGGEDPGAIGTRGTYEKSVTLKVGKQLRERLQDGGIKVLMTRDSDFFVPLGERVTKARAVRADLFVSIHADAFVRPDAHGSSVFMLSDRGASSAFAKWLAKTQNDADLIGGVKFDTRDPYLASTLLDLTTTATHNDSLRLGRSVLSQLGQINTLHSSQVEGAGFAVLKAPDIPSILVETAFISNPEEEKRLLDEDYQDKLTSALYSGIKNYLGHSGVARNS